MDTGFRHIQPRHLKRAGLARAQLFAHVVEGELLTSRELAERLGISIGAAYDRAKRGPFPLTWASLRCARLPARKEQNA